jgi:beta-galactosidase
MIIQKFISTEIWPFPLGEGGRGIELEIVKNQSPHPLLQEGIEQYFENDDKQNSAAIATLKGIWVKSIILLFVAIEIVSSQPRTVENFNANWQFLLGNDSLAFQTNYDNSRWRVLNLPHDWSIEGAFSKDAPCKTDGGALPTGIGWYRKTFTIPTSKKNKLLYINFDGVYRNSEVWINGHYLGKRPNGYISFQYELTPYLNFGKKHNVLAVKVDNSAQPNSRWYTGSGIYRNVWLISTEKVHIAKWGTYITTPLVSNAEATVKLSAQILNKSGASISANVTTVIYNHKGEEVASKVLLLFPGKSPSMDITQDFTIQNPILWNTDQPYLYKALTQISVNNKITDELETPFGIRHFEFDSAKGFSFNGKYMKILGVCNHHDLGALGAAVNKRAMERQLQILKEMGCNAIRTAHNPPAPELLNLCDSMGFLVQVEAFDMWKKKKNKADYHIDWNEWHIRDLEDMVKRDRNHPSVFMWSIGNEIREQFDSTGITITRELTDIVKKLDKTRPVTNALTENDPDKNYIWKSGALDVLGFNYKHEAYPELPKRFPGQKFIASEISCAEATRGHYDMPSDSIRIWPKDSKEKFTGNPDWTASAYDHVYAYWGSTHEAAWKAIRKYPFISGVFVWSGFDYLGEPTPYPWPARSSYFGVIDLAGFPKDAYYMYQSEWFSKPVLHIFPHWNWEPGKLVDVWAYYNNADEVELFLNGESLGIKKKDSEDIHVMWRVQYQPGTLKAISRKKGQVVLTKEVKTAGKPAKIVLIPDRNIIKADGADLSFVTVKITDANGVLVPNADYLVNFTISGEGFIAGVDNGYQASLEPFKANYRKAFNGMCLAIIQSNGKPGKITLEASSEVLLNGKIEIKCE